MRNTIRAYVLSGILLLTVTPRGRAADSWLSRGWRKDVPLAASQPAPKSDTIAACDALLMRGQYAPAANGYRKLLTAKTARVSAAIGLARAVAARGRYAAALKTLNDVADQAAGRTDWRLARAETLTTLGRYDEALADAQAARKIQADSAEAILAEGMLLETLGRKDQAKAVYKSMSVVVAGDAYKQDAAALVALGQILDRYAILSGQRASEQAPNILHNYFQQAYQHVDENYWPAHVAAGWFLLSKHRPTQAAQEFVLALKRNNQCPQAALGLAMIELSKYQFERCLRLTGRARSVNPHDPDMRLVQAVCYMQWRKFDRVMGELDAALKINPNSLDALSLAAAAQMRLHSPAKAQGYIDRVRKINPHYAQLDNTIGEWLAAGRQYRQAEKHYRRAMATAPELADPMTHLGLLYMQTGDEDKAHAILEKAHALDNYRKDVVNYLNVLAVLKKFAVKETEHFIVKVSPQPDGVLLEQVCEYMESIYPEVTRDFSHTPVRKTLIEFFPKHQQFSARISGRGWIPTVGASTGRVIVLVSPNKTLSQFGQYNWATVLRHEFTHTVTLSATDNRIPHWLTEACAVWQQPDRRNYEAVNQLVAATRSGRLMPVRELDWGFIRPKRKGDRSLAYAQAEWALEYIITTRGFDTLARMLEAFRDGSDQATVFKNVLGTTEAKFDKAFGAYAKTEIKRWGFPADPPPDPRKAAADVKAKPNDAAAQAAFADVLLAMRRYPQAETAAQKALTLQGDNTKAMAVLAQALLAQKKYPRAAEIARKLHDLDKDSQAALQVMAAGYLQQRKWAAAIASLEALKIRQPLVPYSYQELAKIYRLMGDNDKALPNLIELHRRTMTDPQYARQVAEIYTAQDQYAPAVRYYKEVARINPYDVSAYESLAAIHRMSEQYDKAVGAIANVCLLQPDSADAWAKMAMMRFLVGREGRDAEQLKLAREAADKALSIDSNSQAAQIRQMIDAELKGLDGQ